MPPTKPQEEAPTIRITLAKWKLWSTHLETKGIYIFKIIDFCKSVLAETPTQTILKQRQYGKLVYQMCLWMSQIMDTVIL